MTIFYSSVLLLLAQMSSDDSIDTSLVMSPRSLISLMLLAVTAVLSGGIYLWVLRYVCIGCCQPIAAGSKSEALAGMV